MHDFLASILSSPLLAAYELLVPRQGHYSLSPACVCKWSTQMFVNDAFACCAERNAMIVLSHFSIAV